MSYRELRDAAEILRSLGFPRLVSIENFRLPNFNLMAEILEWAVTKFDSNSRFSKTIDNETDRIIFVKACVLNLIQKARVRLNPKNLYQSDGYAIRELLIVLRMLYATNKQNAKNTKSNKIMPKISEMRAKINAIRQEMRHSIQLGVQIPQSAANIYDLLSKEIFLKISRGKALSQLLNANEVEGEVNQMIEQIEQRTVKIQYKLLNISTDEQVLERKIERRQREYDQLQKRLIKLQSFRPPYMDEYEKYEMQLKELYDVYVVLFRNLSHLQQQLSEVERSERERMANAEHNMRLAVDKMRMENDILAPPMVSEMDEDVNLASQFKEVKVFGNMIGAGLSDDEDDEEVGDDVEEDDDEIMNIERNSRSSEIDEKTLFTKNLDDALNDEDLSDIADTKNLEAIMENENKENSDDDF